MSELAGLDEGFIKMVTKEPQQQQRSSHGMYVEFYMHPKEDPEASIDQGRPIFKEVPYIKIMVPGDKNSVVQRPVLTGQHPNHDNNRFHNEYIAFKDGLMTPVEGTILEQWPQITRSQVLELQYLGIMTVEHLANLNDGKAGQFMGLSGLKQKAQKFLDVTALDAPLVQLQEELVERDNKIDTLENAMDEMKNELAELKGGKTKKG